MADMDSPATHWVGQIDHRLIVNALVTQAMRQSIRAEDIAAAPDEVWVDLAGKAFGVSFGSVRLAVLLELVEADEEILHSRRMRSNG